MILMSLVFSAIGAFGAFGPPGVFGDVNVDAGLISVVVCPHEAWCGLIDCDVCRVCGVSVSC